MISIIVATDKNGLIGNGHNIPWMGKLPTDMQFFKLTTLNKIVIMGRKTMESLGKPLSNRTNIVISRTVQSTDGFYIYPSVDEVLHEYYEYCHTEDEVFVIGGASIYEQLLPYTDRIYHTIIDHEFDGDTYFPLGKIDSNWKLVESFFIGEKEDWTYYHEFNVLDRIR